MIQQENIDGRIKKAFLDKKLHLQRRFSSQEDQQGNLTEGNYFFNNDILSTIGGAFDDVTQNYNPIDQEFYRMVWAKVCVAVPDIPRSQDSQNAGKRIIYEPISLSSYQNFDGNFLPLAFNKNSRENTDNMYRGHSGITSIKSTQKEFFTNEYVVEWECPDPIYFEEVFEPSFLNLGACMTFEFGYGDNYGAAQIPPITIPFIKACLTKSDDELIDINDRLQKTAKELRESYGIKERDYNDDGEKSFSSAIRERNMIAPGNYFLDIGVVQNFDFKIDSNGVYKGSITALSMGASPLLETSEPKDESERGFDAKMVDIIQRNKLGKEILEESLELSPEQQSEIGLNRNEILRDAKQTNSDLKKLLESGTTFKAVIKNIDKVLDKYFTTNGIKNFTPFTNEKTVYPLPEDTKAPVIDYKFKDGALKIKFEKRGYINIQGFKNTDYDENENFTNKYFMSWGFFEDILLRSFFELSSKDVTLQEIRSVDNNNSNKCISSPFLYSMGLKSVILPGRTHPLLTQPFREFTKTDGGTLVDEIEIVRKLYKPKQLKNLEVTKTIFDMFDSLYQPFDFKKDETGYIRHMVFPIEMYKKHFENATSLRQSLTNFWSDVSSMYGGLWRFVVGQSQSQTTRIGVSDLRLAPPAEDLKLTQEEKLINAREKEVKKIGKCFLFELVSKDSIVKSYELSLDMSEEAATLARYGKYSPKDGASKVTSIADVSTEAFNLLTKSKSVQELLDQNAFKKKVDKANKLLLEEGIVRDLSYVSDNGKSSRYKISDNYKGENGKIIRELNDDGFDFNTIPEVSTDAAEELEKINNDYSSLYRGVGIYDKDGNMSAYFKKVMIHLLVYSKFEQSKSLITTHPILIPVSISMTLDGIGGLRVGNIFKVDYLPAPYRNNTYFVINKVEHSVTSAGWSTDIGAYMQFNPDEYKVENRGDFPSIKEKKLRELFEYTSTEVDFQDVIMNLSDTTGTSLQQYINNAQATVNDFDNTLQFFGNDKDGNIIFNDKQINKILESPNDYYYILGGSVRNDEQGRQTTKEQLVRHMQRIYNSAKVDLSNIMPFSTKIEQVSSDLTESTLLDQTKRVIVETEKLLLSFVGSPEFTEPLRDARTINPTLYIQDRGSFTTTGPGQVNQLSGNPYPRQFGEDDK